MNINCLYVINSIILISFIFVSLLFGFIISKEELIKKTKYLGMIAFIIGVICFCIGVFYSNKLLVIPMFMLFIPIIKRICEINYVFSIIIVMLSVNLYSLHFIIVKSVVNCLLIAGIHNKVEIYSNILTIIIYIVLTAVMLLKKVVIFSPNVDIYIFLKEKEKYKFKVNVILTIFILCISLLWNLYVNNHWSKYSIIEQLVISIFAIIIFILFIYFIRILFLYETEKAEILIDKEYQSELLGFMQVIRSQRHDFNFHLQAISGMLDNRKYEECNDYIKTMVNQASMMNDVLPLYHPAVSALLNTFREIATQKGIRLEVLVYYNLENVPCTVYEINKIIGNLVQNAIDEIEDNPGTEKWVKVLIMKRGENNVIKVSNETNKDTDSYKNVFNPGYSTKKKHEGIGLVTVHRIVSKYQGMVYLEFEDNIVHFIAKIPLKY